MLSSMPETLWLARQSSMAARDCALFFCEDFKALIIVHAEFRGIFLLYCEQHQLTLHSLLHDIVINILELFNFALQLYDSRDLLVEESQNMTVTIHNSIVHVVSQHIGDIFCTIRVS